MASLLPMAIEMWNPMYDFATLLFYYSQRSLTNQGDALNGMEGIIRQVSSKSKCEFFEGMPTAAIDLFVLFRSHRGPL